MFSFSTNVTTNIGGCVFNSVGVTLAGLGQVLIYNHKMLLKIDHERKVCSGVFPLWLLLLWRVSPPPFILIENPFGSPKKSTVINQKSRIIMQ